MAITEVLSEARRFNSQPEDWTLHQLRVDGPMVRAVTPEDGQPVEPFPSQDVEAPVQWRFCSIPNPRRDPRHPEFQRSNPRSLVRRDEEDCDAIIEGWKAGQMAAFPDGEPPPLDPERQHSFADLAYSAEYESWSKLTLQVGTMTTWHLDLPQSDMTPADLSGFADAARELAREYEDNGRALLTKGFEPRPPPADTVGGWPGFGSGPPAHLLASLFCNPDDEFGRAFDEGASWATANGIHPATTFGFGLGGRSGPTAKPTLFWKYDEGRWIRWLLSLNAAQRNRIVYMAMKAFNLRHWRLYTWLKAGQIGTVGMYRLDPRSPGRVGRRRYKFMGDLSGFDQHVSSDCRAVLADAIASVRPDLMPDLEFWLHAEEHLLLTPSLSLEVGGVGVGVRHQRNGLKSGQITTSVIGTMINAILARAALRNAGLKRHEWDFEVQGDDIYVGTDRPISCDGWASSYARAGFKASLVPGDIFLSAHQDSVGLQTPVGGRIVQQTCSNEAEPVGGAWVIGLLMLGFLERTRGAERLSPQLQRAVVDGLSGVRWLRPYLRPRSLTRTRAAIEAVADPLIDRALKKREGVSWFARTIRGREHSALGRLLYEAFPELAKGVEASDLHTFRLCQQAQTLSRDVRLELASSGYATIAAGEDAALGWYALAARRLGSAPDDGPGSGAFEDWAVGSLEPQSVHE